MHLYADAQGSWCMKASRPQSLYPSRATVPDLCQLLFCHSHRLRNFPQGKQRRPSPVGPAKILRRGMRAAEEPDIPLDLVGEWHSNRFQSAVCLRVVRCARGMTVGRRPVIQREREYVLEIPEVSHYLYQIVHAIDWSTHVNRTNSTSTGFIVPISRLGAAS